MPSISTLAWETLLEPRVRDSFKNTLNSQQQIPKSSIVVDDEDEEEKKNKKRTQTPNHIYISPALYTTPAPAPIPDSSFPLSPSPYVVNHKRRGGDAVARRAGGFDETPQLKSPPDGETDSNSNGDVVVVVEEVVDDGVFGMETGGEDRDGGSVVAVVDDFFDPRCESVSVGSSAGVDDFGKQVGCPSFVSNQGEFFDASEVLGFAQLTVRYPLNIEQDEVCRYSFQKSRWNKMRFAVTVFRNQDDFSTDGSTSNFSSYGPRIESELRATRLSLLEEIEKRKAAEYAVGQMYTQWQRLGNLLSQVGLTFPTAPNATSMQFEIDSLEQLCQELLVTRFVAEAIGRGQARAEAEIAAEVIIESKDQEISRLRDRLQYYEAVNREMSQRNQEVMEVARRQRQRRKTQRRRWLWGCVGLSVAIGTSVIAYSYLPHTSKHHTSQSSCGSSDASCINVVESA
ncbi:hypothetical protein TEA_001096 [Camellia sinensis var. sinensis]|uniref:Uncharacterized protein n=1 Tax=Camellia sinensis var. sinensis TaxID=542762 RepID=A0A4S4DB19_CAMSN|nr:hypothetical protein TEA_001096 [Camellia sinensis var. sinensis]